MWLVAGLGNPGDKYAQTRHNVGFMLVDVLHRNGNMEPFKKDFSGFYAKGSVGQTNAHLLKPQIFMNCSGCSVQAAARFFKLSPENIIVVHDDMDLEFGVVRVKVSGGHGGHNGLRNIIGVMGRDFIRVRLGIGRSPFKGNESNYVLENFRKADRVVLDQQLTDACDAVQTIVEQGVEQTQRQFN